MVPGASLTLGEHATTITVEAPGARDLFVRIPVVVHVTDGVAAGFEASVIHAAPGEAIDFHDLSVGAVTTWEWDFGDGGTDARQDATHVYRTAGTYTVSLTVRSSDGRTDQAVKDRYIVIDEKGSGKSDAGQDDDAGSTLERSLGCGQ